MTCTVVTGRYHKLKRALTSLWPAPVNASLSSSTSASSIERTTLDAADLERWCAERSSEPRLYIGRSAESVSAIRERYPRLVACTLTAAERALRHEFELLGSGPFVPIDPERPAHDAYMPIDWYLDPVRNLRFPRGVPHKEWKLYEMRPENADVKYPWELGRCQHWVVLGQAYRLTRDERFAREIASELDDFVAANPLGIGINWTCTMDVALRAVSWAIGLELVRDSALLDGVFWRRAYSALAEHGVFICNNLENTYEVTSNHFLSNIVGLWFLGTVFQDVPQAQEWRGFARAALEREIEGQVLPDGADFESSVPYHRFVTELFLGCLRLGEVTGEPLSDRYKARVRDMVAYLAAVTRPDGLMPQVGDADDGRLHILSGLPVTSPQDGRHLFGPASVILNEPSWLDVAGPEAGWEIAWWGLDPDGARRSVPPKAVRSALFPHAGVAVMRSDHAYVLVTNGIVGTKGFGNHKHNDQLSFECHFDGAPLLVDPGSYVYTSDPDARNLFRSTAYHNTVRIDSQEQNEIKPEWLFRMFETANAEHLAFLEEPEFVEYHGCHAGYRRLAEPVTHTRGLRLLSQTPVLVVVDVFEGSGVHELVWHFHCAPGVTLSEAGSGRARIDAAGASYTLQFSSSFRPALVPSWYSPSYGMRSACQALELTWAGSVSDARTWHFALYRRDAIAEMDLFHHMVDLERRLR